jgi:hypothetical protein
VSESHSDTEARAVDAALAELRRIRRAATPYEWETLQGEAIANARSAGATPEQVDDACAEPGN